MAVFHGFDFVLLLVSVLFFPCAEQLQTSQIGALQQLRKHLEFPSQLDFWENYYGDFCNVSSSLHVSVSCEGNIVSELKIMGDKASMASEFHGFAIPNRTLSEKFSIDSFVTTLTRLPGLKVLNLVSLGIWGPLPDKIHRLSSLEILDLSSNFMFGSIPAKLSAMVKLNTLTLDGNYFNDSALDWLDSLSNLTVLSLKNNRLDGEFPVSVSRISTITDIALSGNQFSGKLPDMRALTSLHVLDLRQNQFDSELPLLPKGLVTVLLSKNSFSGDIPEQFSDLAQLQHLDLSFNSLSGNPPLSLFSLPNISYLNLASNMLSGSLPNKLTCGGKLGFVDISNNRLTGKIPVCLARNSNNRFAKFNGNCLSVDSEHQHSVSYCGEGIKGEKSRRGTVIAVLVSAITGAILLLVLFVVSILFFCRKYRSRKKDEHSLPKPQDNPVVCSDLVTSARLISQAAKLESQGIPVCRVFSYQELREATGNFGASKFMGEGSMGKLHKGKLENGTVVAVRSLAFMKKHSVQNLRVQLEFLSKLHHPNLVNLLGYCTESGGQDGPNNANKVFLVYEYVPNGSYRFYLSENSSEKILKWSDRLAILIGVAKAVHFLHTGVIPGCLNNRLKTNNILLDEHRIPKLSDYGISMIKEEVEKPEAKREGQKSSHRKNLEDDVYNFGFILLESLVGPIVSGKGETFLLNEMTSFGSQDGRRKIVDPIVLTTCSQESLTIVVSITKKCITPEPSSRPSFEDVLWNLQYAAQVQATADADQ